MDLNPYIANGEEADETLGAIATALVGLKPGKPVFFLPEAPSSNSAWESWLTTKFLPLISPHLVAVRETCQSISPREVATLDSKFSSLLDPGEFARSTSAARILRDALGGARHRPELDKVIATLDSQNSVGHFPTLFAARCASHHVSLASSLAAYLYFEFVSGIPAQATPPSSILPRILPAVRIVLDSRPPRSYRVA